MSRTQRVQAVAAAVAIVGAAMTAARIQGHTDGEPFSWRFFAGLAITIVGAVVCGSATLHVTSDREGLYRLGYTAGRIDAIREMNGPGRVEPLRPVPNGLHDFSRRAGAGRPGRQLRRVPAPDERADTPG